MRDVELYQQLLGVVSPWTVSRVEMSVEGEPAARAPLKDLWQLERLPGVQFEQSACQPARAAG